MEQRIIRMAIAVKIRCPCQVPAVRKGWREVTPDQDLIVSIPYRCLMAVSVLKHKVRVAVAVKVGYDSPGHARYQRMRVSVRRVTWQRRVVKVIQALHETWAHTRVNALS